MESIDRRLSAEETVLYRARRHWGILFGPVLVMGLGTLSLKSQTHALSLVLFGLIWFICSYVSLSNSEIKLTQKRLLIDVGFPLKRSLEIMLDKIVAIDYYQPSLGLMLNFGKIVIVYEEKKMFSTRFISSPADFVREVRKQIIAFSEGKHNK